MSRLCPHRRQERPDAHDVDDARQIVSQHVQRHLGGDLGSRRRCTASRTCSCSHRVIRRSFAVVQAFLMAQFWQTLVQWRRSTNAFLG